MSDPGESQVSSPEPIAVVKGEPLSVVPGDLFIPPDALEVFLEAFEGPLDLLLYLIKRQNIDILDIPVASITHQYIRYIETMNQLRMELAAEYLVMAAMLTEIKSRFLLPRPVDTEQEDDPRAELVRRLQEYECFKKASEALDALPRIERDIFEVTVGTETIKVERKEPDVDLKEVVIAFQEVLRRAEQVSHHHIQREPLSVRERMANILDRLQSVAQLPFSDLFNRKEGRQGAVVSLLAILELCKDGLIEITQSEPLAALHVRPLTS